MFFCLHIYTFVCLVYLFVSRWQQVLMGVAHRTSVMSMPSHQANPAACPAFKTTSGNNQFAHILHAIVLYDLTSAPSWFIH